MTILRAELAQRIFDSPLMMHAGKAITALTAIGGRIVDGGVHIKTAILPVDHLAGERMSPSMGRIGDRLGRAYDSAGVLPFALVDGVAVIPIEGTLVHKGAYVGMSSGRTSYEGIQAQVVRARRNDQVRGVVFEIDSFGGEVAGAFETANVIAELSAAKPTIAILTDFAMSAGYLMASAARQIVMPATGRAGSIGVITLHADYSAKLEDQGVKVTILSAGAHKADGNSFEPLPEDVADAIRSELEVMREAFADAVGRYRGQRFTATAALNTEAKDYSGEEAVKLGLADAVGAGGHAFDAFISEVNRA